MVIEVDTRICINGGANCCKNDLSYGTDTKIGKSLSHPLVVFARLLMVLAYFSYFRCCMSIQWHNMCNIFIYLVIVRYAATTAAVYLLKFLQFFLSSLANSPFYPHSTLHTLAICFGEDIILMS